MAVTSVYTNCACFSTFSKTLLRGVIHLAQPDLISSVWKSSCEWWLSVVCFGSKSDRGGRQLLIFFLMSLVPQRRILVERIYNQSVSGKNVFHYALEQFQDTIVNKAEYSNLILKVRFVLNLST